MPDGFDLNLDDEDFRRRLEWVVLQLLDLRPFWPKVVSMFIGWMRDQFESEGVYGLGHPWAPLSPKYAAWKAVHFPGKGILVAESDLRKAASKPVRRATAHTLTLTIPWAEEKGKDVRVEWHQFGVDAEVGEHERTSKKGKRYTVSAYQLNIPPRPILFGDPLLPAPRAELDKVMDEYLEELLGKVGLA